MIDDIDFEPGEGSSPSAKYLMAIYETLKVSGDDEKVSFGIVAVQPSTGDIIYDEFEDGRFRSELETRILHLQPSEFLLPPILSKPTEKLISFICERRYDKLFL